MTKNTLLIASILWQTEYFVNEKLERFAQL